MEMSVQIVGDTAVRLKLQAMPEKLRSALLTKMDFLSKYLQRYVVTQKLSGQVLNKRSGDLQRSISQQVTTSGDTVTAKVYSDSSVAPYAGIHEFGGKTPPHIIEAKNGKALMFDWNGKTVFFQKVNHPGSTMPERSFLRSSLDENRDYIVSELQRTVDQVMSK
jgi:phage gpG-like protein